MYTARCNPWYLKPWKQETSRWTLLELEFQVPSNKNQHIYSTLKKNENHRLNTVDGRNPAPPGMYKTLVNNGRNYPPQLVQDFVHQQYCFSRGISDRSQEKFSASGLAVFVGLAALTMWAVHMLANRVSCQKSTSKNEKKLVLPVKTPVVLGTIHVQIVPKGCFFLFLLNFEMIYTQLDIQQISWSILLGDFFIVHTFDVDIVEKTWWFVEIPWSFLSHLCLV